MSIPQPNTARRVEDSERRKYRTEIPNMVDDMGLSVYAFRLYAHMKRVAGDSGVCWQSTRTLARACNMSEGSVSNAKKELKARGLITKDYRLGISDRFIIVDVWDDNYRKYIGRRSSGEHEAQSFQYSSLDEGGVQGMNITRSLDEIMNKHREELTREEIKMLSREQDRLEPLISSPEYWERYCRVTSLIAPSEEELR